MSERRAIPYVYTAIFFTSFALNFFQNQWLLHPSKDVWADMAFYVDQGERFANHGPSSDLDSFYPPGNGYFFSLFFRLLSPNLAMQLISVVYAVMLASANVFLGRTTALFLQNDRLGALVAVAAALYWPFAAAGSFFLSEPLFIFLLLGAQYLFALGASSRVKRISSYCFFFSAFVFGLAALVRTQALFTAICFVVTTFAFRRLRVRALPVMLAGLAAVLLPYSFRSGSFEPKISNNDAYVFYLGQTRAEGVGGVEADGWSNRYFANNNFFSGFLFFPPEILDHSLNDRAYLLREGLRLWHESPARQLLRSTENLIELFTIRPSWPLLNHPEFISADLGFQWAGFVLFLLPALNAVIVSVLRNRLRFAVCFFGLPIVGIGFVAFCGTGQPRYLLPYYYNFIPLAAMQYVRWAAAMRSERLGAKVMLETAVFGVTTLGLFWTASRVREAYEKTVPAAVAQSPESYELLSSLSPPPDRSSPIYWFEPGKPNRDLKFGAERSLLPGADVQQSGFTSYRRLNRAAPNVLETTMAGQLKVFLPFHRATHVGIFLVDPDSFRRSSIVGSEAEKQIAQHLHDGRWLTFSVSEAERESGVKTFQLQKVNGDSIAISAVIIYQAQENSVLQ